MQNYVKCLESMVEASKVFGVEEEVKNFVENHILKIVSISKNRYLEDEGSCGECAKFLKILREDIGLDFGNEMIVDFGRLVKSRFLSDEESLNLDKMSEW